MQFLVTGLGLDLMIFVKQFSLENNWVVDHCLTPEIFVPLLQKVTF